MKLTIICEKCDKIKQEELKEKYTRCQIYGDPEYWCYKEFYSVRLLYKSMYSAQTEKMLTYEEVFGHKLINRKREGVLNRWNRIA